MPVSTKEVQLGERRFILSQLPAMRGLRLAARLGKVMGPAAVGAVAAGGLNSEAMPALATLFDRLSPDELEQVTRELLGNAQVVIEGKNGSLMDSFDVLFQGRLHEVLQLLREALVLNYGESFTALVAAASEHFQKAASASSSTKS